MMETWNSKTENVLPCLNRLGWSTPESGKALSVRRIPPVLASSFSDNISTRCPANSQPDFPSIPTFRDYRNASFTRRLHPSQSESSCNLSVTLSRSKNSPQNQCVSFTNPSKFPRSKASFSNTSVTTDFYKGTIPAGNRVRTQKDGRAHLRGLPLASTRHGKGQVYGGSKSTVFHQRFGGGTVVSEPPKQAALPRGGLPSCVVNFLTTFSPRAYLSQPRRFRFREKNWVSIP